MTRRKEGNGKSAPGDAPEPTFEELFAKARKAHRKATAKHVLVFEADLDEHQQRIALHISEELGDIEHRIVADMQKRLRNLCARKSYKRLRKYYRAAKDAFDDAKARCGKLGNAVKEQGKPADGHQSAELEALALEIEVCEADLAHKEERLDALVELEGITKKRCCDIAARMSAKSKYPISVFALAVAEDVWGAVEKVLYGDARKIHARGRYRTIRAKQANKALVLKNDGGRLAISNQKGIGKFGFKEDPADLFAAEEVAAILDFLSEKGREDACIEHFMETGEVTDDTFRPVYAMLKPEMIRGKWRFFCHITVEGHPKPKRKRDGSPRHDRSKTGKLGIDQGTSTYAVCGEDICEMKNLAERDGRSTLAGEAKERRIRRKMERSRRANNPDNYAEDGSVKKGRKTWENSNTYEHDRRKLADIKRKNAASRRYAIQEDVNRLREHGDAVVTERQSIAGLAKKGKRKKKVDEKTGKARDRRRKRYGRAVQNRCPGLFRAELKKKFAEYHEVAILFRASQYDHELDAYIKKPLSQRTHHHRRGRASPRDMYSSFLLWCADDEYSRVDRVLCISRFDDYYDRVQDMMDDYRKRGVRVLNSGF